MAFLFSVISLVVLFSDCYADKFVWTQCGGQDTIVMDKLDITPMPMKMPGDIFLTIDAHLLKQLNGSDVHIDIYRKTFLGTVKIPCLFEVGSCTYRDTCNIMDRMKKEDWGGMMAFIISQIQSIFLQKKINIKCPVPIQTLKLDNIPLTLPSIPSFMRIFASGNYEINLKTIDRYTHKTTYCINMHMSMSAG